MQRNDQDEMITILEKLKYLDSEDFDTLNEHVQNTIVDSLNNESFYLLMSSDENKEEKENILKQIKEHYPIPGDILFDVIAFVQARKTKLDNDSYTEVLQRYQPSEIESFQKKLETIETIFYPLTRTLTKIQIADDLKTFKEFIQNIPSKEQKEAQDIERKVETLRQACNDYKTHLEKEIGYNNSKGDLGTIGSMAESVSEHPDMFNELSRSKIIAYKKYHAMNTLLATLDDPKPKIVKKNDGDYTWQCEASKTNKEKIQAFHANLQEHKALIEQDRSFAASKFKKVMSKVFGETRAEKMRLFFFGRTEGTKFNQNLESKMKEMITPKNN